MVGEEYGENGREIKNEGEERAAMETDPNPKMMNILIFNYII
jgi:hypothetical protein